MSPRDHGWTGGDELERMLTDKRPVPSAGFRAEVRSELLSAGKPNRPAQLGRMIVGYAGAGAVLLFVAAIGLAGAGPLAS